MLVNEQSREDELINKLIVLIEMANWLKIITQGVIVSLQL